MRLFLSSRVFPAGVARFRPLLTLACWYAVLGLLLRVVLWWSFGRAQQVEAAAFAWALASGVLSDIVQSTYLLAPFAIFLWLVPDRFYSAVGGRAALLAGTFVWMFAFTFGAAVEYFFFEEFDARLNLVAVDYLMYPTEVVGDIWEAWPGRVRFE